MLYSIEEASEGQISCTKYKI